MNKQHGQNSVNKEFARFDISIHEGNLLIVDKQFSKLMLYFKYY